MIVVIPHTLGRHLNFNCHLHILVSEGNLREDGTAWRARARLDKKALMPMWRYAVITLLREAARAGVLETDMPRGELLRLLTAQYERWWNIDVKRFKSKKQFLGYAGRYARRPPIAQHRFRTIGRQEIRFVTKDTRTQQSVETTYTPAEFLATLADHVPPTATGTPCGTLGCSRLASSARRTTRSSPWWARSGGGSPDGSDGRRHRRNALAWTRWSTATASECGGLLAFHPASRTDSLPARAYVSPAVSEPPASRDLTAPRSRDRPSRRDPDPAVA